MNPLPEVVNFVFPAICCLFCTVVGYCLGRTIGKAIGYTKREDEYIEEFGERGVPCLPHDIRVMILEGLLKDELSGYYAGGTLCYDFGDELHMFHIGDGDSYYESYLIAKMYLKHKSVSAYYYLDAMRTVHEYETIHIYNDNHKTKQRKSN